MRAVYLSTDHGIAYGGTKGASVHVAEITRSLAAEGAEVLVLAAAIADDSAPPPAGVTVEVAPADGCSLARRVDEFGPRVLIERLALNSSIGSEAAATLGVPHLVELNSPLPQEAALYRGLERPEAAEEIEATVLGGAAVVFAVSRPLARYAAERGAPNVEVLPNGASIDRFPPAPVPTAIDAPAVLAGTLRPWHGAATVAEAWHLLGRGAPRLLVVGGGPGRDVLEAAGAEVAGPIPHAHMPALLATCAVGLVPYAADAPLYFSPLKLFDYLAAGLAVVAGDRPGVTDIVDAESAVVVPAGDAGALAAAVEQLFADAPRRAALGRAGRHLVERHHTWAHRARRILAVADELVSAESVR